MVPMHSFALRVVPGLVTETASKQQLTLYNLDLTTLEARRADFAVVAV